VRIGEARAGPAELSKASWPPTSVELRLRFEAIARNRNHSRSHDAERRLHARALNLRALPG
jgi:hypothetical protein